MLHINIYYETEILGCLQLRKYFIIARNGYSFFFTHINFERKVM